MMNIELSNQYEYAASRVIKNGFGASIMSRLRKAKSRIVVMIHKKKQRRDLAQLDERLLRDIGLTEEEVINEINKPPWR